MRGENVSKYITNTYIRLFIQIFTKYSHLCVFICHFGECMS